LYASAEAVCNSCYAYVDPDQGTTAQNAYSYCILQDSVFVANCLQDDYDETGRCLSCNTDYYLQKSTNSCEECSDDLKSSAGCKRCDASECLECENGYYRTTGEDGYLVCEACDLTEFNADYIFEPNRCT
jgi:hypothetical protein